MSILHSLEPPILPVRADCGVLVPRIDYRGRQMERFDSITLDEVAARAGVSPGTVSRILNGKNKENRPANARRSDRIRKIATDLGYRPNAAARSMMRGNFQAVSFVTCGDLGADWYPISGLNGIHTTLDKMAWRLIFNELPASVIKSPELVPNLFRESSVDGLLINLVPAFTNEVADYFESQTLPCVWLNLKRRLRSVYPDEIGGAAMGIRWFTRQGCRRIGFFSRMFSAPPHFSATERLEGFERALTAEGLAAHRRLEMITADDPLNVDLLERAKQFLHTFPDTDGVLCYELEETVCMRVAAETMGRVVGKDLQLLSYGEREIRSLSGLKIPTLVTPFHDVGARAVEMLAKMIERNQQDVQSVKVPFRSILL